MSLLSYTPCSLSICLRIEIHMYKSLFLLLYKQAMWCVCSSLGFLEKVGGFKCSHCKTTITVPQRTKLAKYLLLANGYSLKPSQEFALTDVSWWRVAQKSMNYHTLHPVSVGTLLSCNFCVSIKLGWKQSLLFTEQILCYVKRWTITTITLSTISISSVKNA